MAILGCACRRGGGGGSGSITTTHEHYTDFEIDGVAFRCYGDLTFKDGDKVRLYGVKTDKGYYYVVLIQNFTRDFYAGEEPANPAEFSKYKEYKRNKRKDEFWDDAIVGAVCCVMGGPVIGIPVALVAWGFYDAQFWKTFKITWLIIAIAFFALFVTRHIIPKSESAKQKEKQQEVDELNRRKEAWAMYQKVINDDDE